MKKRLSFLSLLLQAVIVGKANYVLNGDFETSSVHPGFLSHISNSDGVLSPWNGVFTLMGSAFGENLGTGQAVNLATNVNGYI